MGRSTIRHLRGLSNLEFLCRYAKQGCIGLFGGSSTIDRAIRRGQRSIDRDSQSSLWSHAAVFQGERTDGRHWLLESDFDLGKGQVRNGAQENRVDKYRSEKDWPNLAILDFGLSTRRSREIVVAGLDLVSRRTAYDLGGILETYWAMVRRRLHEADRKGDSTFCSAFVRTVFHHAGIDLAPGVAIQHTLPEHVSRTGVAHTCYRLVRDPA